MEVCGKQRGCADVGHDVLSNGPGKAKAIIGGCATAQLVNDDQGPGSNMEMHTHGISKMHVAWHLLDRDLWPWRM